MSFKPSQNSGIQFDKYSLKSEKNNSLVVEMIVNKEHLNYKNLNKFSKHIYLSWLNDNKKEFSLSQSGYFNKLKPKYCISFYAKNQVIWSMILRNRGKLYKPLDCLLLEYENLNLALN